MPFQLAPEHHLTTNITTGTSQPKGGGQENGMLTFNERQDRFLVLNSFYHEYEKVRSIKQLNHSFINECKSTRNVGQETKPPTVKLDAHRLRYLHDILHLFVVSQLPHERWRQQHNKRCWSSVQAAGPAMPTLQSKRPEGHHAFQEF